MAEGVDTHPSLPRGSRDRGDREAVGEGGGTVRKCAVSGTLSRLQALTCRLRAAPSPVGDGGGKRCTQQPLAMNHRLPKDQRLKIKD